MKLKILILTIGLGGPLLLSNFSAQAQDADASSDKKVEQLEAELADEKNKSSELNSESSADLKDLKRAHKEAKRKSKEARSIQSDASNAEREAKRAYKAEKRAQKARKDAEKQAEKAKKAKRVSDGNR